MRGHRKLTVTGVELSLVLYHGEEIPNHLLARSPDDSLVSVPTGLDGWGGVGGEVDLGGEPHRSIDLGGLGGRGRVLEALRRKRLGEGKSRLGCRERLELRRDTSDD